MQTGIGRTGELFAYQRTGVTPDIMALAKALGGGFPLGACLATAEAGKGMTAGTHGSTFGGNPLAMAVGNAVLDVMLAEASSTASAASALLFKQRLAEIKDRYPDGHRRGARRGAADRPARVVPNGELVDALRAEKLLAVARRRQRRAAAAAADRQRGRSRRGDRAGSTAPAPRSTRDAGQAARKQGAAG